jgi:hypothetical protein
MARNVYFAPLLILAGAVACIVILTIGVIGNRDTEAGNIVGSWTWDGADYLYGVVADDQHRYAMYNGSGIIHVGVWSMMGGVYVDADNPHYKFMVDGDRLTYMTPGRGSWVFDRVA